jgi:hypothetical protein
MNPLNWIKRNPIVLAFVVAFAIALGILGWISHKAGAHRALVEADLQAQRAALDNILRSQPSPSGENLRVLKKDREQLEGHFRELMQHAARQHIAWPEGLTPIEFSRRVDQAAGRIRQGADQRKVRLPDNFRLGFARYEKALPCQQLTGDDCKRVLSLMAKQLYAAEKLCGLLISSGVDEIRGIRRVDVEPAGSAGPDVLGAAISTDPKLQSVHFPFECQFTCGTDNLRTLLNEISKQEAFFAVRGLRIDEESGGPATSRDAKKPVAADKRRLLVTARIDFVEFPEPVVAPAARQ